jgi:hypothetical protein
MIAVHLIQMGYNHAVGVTFVWRPHRRVEKLDQLFDATGSLNVNNKKPYAAL